jgi:ParB-like chromosome segregation protein Spo0J
MTQHPLSAAFPPMPETDFEALVADVAKHGLQSAVVLYQDQVLDGWHRYRACVIAGVEPRVTDFDGADPIAFVLSMNLNRRHLTPSQRAAAVLECEQWRGPGAKAAPVPPPTTAQLAKLADVSPRTIRNAKAAIRKGKLADLKSGAVTAKAAAKPPAPRQRAGAGLRR